MGAQNLIALRQIRQDQLVAFVSSTVATAITAITGSFGTFTSGVETVLSSGASSVVISYSITPAPKIWVGIGYSGTQAQPFINAHPTVKNTTGAIIEFGAAIPSTGYYLETMIKP